MGSAKLMTFTGLTCINLIIFGIYIYGHIYESLYVPSNVGILILDAPPIDIHYEEKNGFYERMKINGKSVDFWYNKCVLPNLDNVKIFDIVFIHSISELSLLEIRIYEYTNYVDHFIIVEHMYFDTGQPRNQSFFGNQANINHIRRNHKIINENWHKIITKQVYYSTYDLGKNWLRFDQEFINKNPEEILSAKYWGQLVRNEQSKILYDECYKLYGSNCSNDNFYVIFSDLDEILRFDLLKLFRSCSNILNTPITVSILTHYYDFMCIDYGRYVLGKSQIHRINEVSFDLRRNNIFPKLRDMGDGAIKLINNPIEKNITIIRQDSESWKKRTAVINGGWHLTSFGNVNDVIFKNMHRGHTLSRKHGNTNPDFTQCLMNICERGIFGEESKNSSRLNWRDIDFVNFGDGYFPLYVQRKIYEQYPKNLFLKTVIETSDNLYDEWKKYEMESDKYTKKRDYCASKL